MYKITKQTPKGYHEGKLLGVKTVDQLIWNELEDEDDFFIDNVLPKEIEYFVKDTMIRNGLNYFNTYVFTYCQRNSLNAYYRKFITQCNNDFKKSGLTSISDITVDDENLGMYYRCNKCIFEGTLVKYLSSRCHNSVVILTPNNIELDILSNQILNCIDKNIINIPNVAQTFCSLGCSLIYFFWANGEAVFEILS